MAKSPVPSTSSDGKDGNIRKRGNGSALEVGGVIDHVEKGQREEAEKKGRFQGGYGFERDKSLWTKFNVPIFKEIRFNPVVSCTAIVLIWTFVAICAYYKQEVPFKEWKRWVVQTFTWLYIGAEDLFFIFALVLYFSKYSNIKLGKQDDTPEYSDPTWFMMLFACGIGTGLFFFGVAEPLFHYIGPNRYTADPTMPDNQVAQNAINLTLFHWGIHGWIVYCLVGLLLALLSYREGLPMTMKSCFYPLIGDRVFGWIGDVIDTVSIITTLFGVCTSLGLGTRQLNQGLTILNPDIPEDDITIQVVIIWCITAVATVSTVSGVGMGIRRLSEICFLVGMFLMVVALFMDNTFYVLNLYVQSIGYYFQNLIQLGTHTDAFPQLGASTGAEDRGRFIPEDSETTDGPGNWMDDWTMFYWGWWISWCPFVGMFIAKISKGRTIRQFINGTLTAPVLYTFMWLVIFGGAGLRLEREAAGAGLCCPDKTGWFGNASMTREVVEERNVLADELTAAGSYWLCEDGECGSCAKQVLENYDKKNHTYGMFTDDMDQLGRDFGSVSADRSMNRLTCHSTEQRWFDVMQSYGDIGPFLSVFSLCGIILYFVTSSDSGSLVIDCLSANGDPDPPRLQRVFWALMEGATATALLVAGGKDGLVALQTAGILSGLPFTFLMCLLCVSIWRAVRVAAGDLDPNGPDFAIGLLDPLFAYPYEDWGTSKTKGSFKLFLRCIKNIFWAPFTLAEVAARVYDSSKMFYLIPALLLFVLAILFLLLELTFNGAWAIGCFFYLGFATFMGSVRIKIRDIYNINGNSVEDIFAAIVMYPFCAVQLDVTTESMAKNTKNKKSKSEDEEAGQISMKEKMEGKANEAYAEGENKN